MTDLTRVFDISTILFFFYNKMIRNADLICLRSPCRILQHGVTHRTATSTVTSLITHNIFLIFIMRIYVLQNIQGDSGRTCNSLGNDSMCDSKQKCSQEHGSDFERLLIYGKKKIRTILRAPCVANVKNCVRKTLECTQFTTVATDDSTHPRPVAGYSSHQLWYVPDVNEPGFCPLQIISNTMVSTCMHVMLVVMLFIT